MGRACAGIGLAAALLSMAACGGSDDGAASTQPTTSPASSSPTASTTATSPAAAPAPQYATRRFVPHITVPTPTWLPPKPVIDERHFLTWVGKGADIDRAVRFMSPIGIYDPGEETRQMRAVPRNFVRYLFGLRKYGAEMTDRASLDLDGHRATLLTARTSVGMSGSLGCQARDLVPNDCYGLQTFAQVRLAVIDVDGTTLLAWARTRPGSHDAEQDFPAFAELLRGMRFR